MISRDTIVDAIRLVAANKQVVIAAKYLGKLKTVTQMISVIFLLLNDFPFQSFITNWSNKCMDCLRDFNSKWY